MEFLRNNSQVIIITVPICWGIYEIRKFKTYKSNLGHNLNEKVNKLSEGDNTVFPIVSQLHLLSQRINVMFTRIYAPLGNESPLRNE